MNLQPSISHIICHLNLFLQKQSFKAFNPINKNFSGETVSYPLYALTCKSKTLLLTDSGASAFKPPSRTPQNTNSFIR